MTRKSNDWEFLFYFIIYERLACFPGDLLGIGIDNSFC